MLSGMPDFGLLSLVIWKRLDNRAEGFRLVERGAGLGAGAFAEAFVFVGNEA